MQAEYIKHHLACLCENETYHDGDKESCEYSHACNLISAFAVRITQKERARPVNATNTEVWRKLVEVTDGCPGVIY